MNARLINTAPESLSAHAETYSQWCRLMLAASEEWADLHFGSARSALQRTRTQWQSLGHDVTPEVWARHCAESFSHAMAEAAEWMRESSRLSAVSRSQLNGLMDTQWEQGKQLCRQLAEEQVALLQSLSTALAGGAEKR